jgi:hypothetical protein
VSDDYKRILHEGDDRSAPYSLSRLAPAFRTTDLAAEVARAESMLSARSGAKLRVIADQIKALQEERNNAGKHSNFEIEGDPCKRLSGAVESFPQLLVAIANDGVDLVPRDLRQGPEHEGIAQDLVPWQLLAVVFVDSIAVGKQIQIQGPGGVLVGAANPPEFIFDCPQSGTKCGYRLLRIETRDKVVKRLAVEAYGLALIHGR